MGVDFYSYSFIGQKIDKHKLSQTVEKPGCSHNPPKGVNFCPQCGKQARITEEEEIVDLESIKELSVCYTTDSEEMFVALRDHYTSSGSSRGGKDTGFVFLSDDAVKAAKKQLKAILEPHGLWDEKHFGLWAVQYCSY